MTQERLKGRRAERLKMAAGLGNGGPAFHLAAR
jgi:hypothetical protein